MTTLRDQRESGQLFDELERIIRDQDEQIQALQRTNENLVMQLKHAILESRKWQSLHPVGTFAYDEENEVWEQLVPDESGIELYALERPEPAFKMSDAGADTNITRGLEPKGSGMVALSQRKWQDLDEDEVIGHTCECVDDGTFNLKCAINFARSIEASIKERNA